MSGTTVRIYILSSVAHSSVHTQFMGSYSDLWLDYDLSFINLVLDILRQPFRELFIYIHYSRFLTLEHIERADHITWISH
jgi:hypothetical protein